MTPREFLNEEKKNVQLALHEALRHDYRYSRSIAFFEECEARLNEISAYLDDARDEELPVLTRQLSDLSQLISSIERSHLGEFPWAFADEVVSIAEPLCTEKLVVGNTLLGDIGIEDLTKKPIFHILSGGGLDSYEIKLDAGGAEDQDTTFCISVNSRIFLIIFPRTLKHHVLLHPILGHEIGHAALSVTNFSVLFQPVIDQLMTGSPLVDDDAFLAWTKDWCVCSDQNTQQPSFLRESWAQEFVCDLLGLIIFGPSFLAAHRTLLAVMDPTELIPKKYHPPNDCRFKLLNQAAKFLGWHELANQFSVGINTDSAQNFWDHFLCNKTNLRLESLFKRLFVETSVNEAVSKCKEILSQLGKHIPFQLPAEGILDELVDQLRSGVPPIRVNHSGFVESTEPLIDFRHILYAGWVMQKEKTVFNFLQLNQLCSLAILQQRAINLSLARAH